MASPGGIDKTNGRFEIVNIYEEKQKCQTYQCERKAGDNRCDEECNTHTCGYDGGDCRLGVNPWKYCNATSRYIHFLKFKRERVQTTWTNEGGGGLLR